MLVPVKRRRSFKKRPGRARKFRKKTIRQGQMRTRTTHSGALIGNAGTSRSNAIKTVTRASIGKQPTEFPPGGAGLGAFISNVRMKTTPNGNGGFGYAFRLTDMPSYADFTAMYQYYKLTDVKMIFYPEQGPVVPNAVETEKNSPYLLTGTKNAADTLGKINGTAPCLVVAPDRNETTPFANVNEALAHAGSQIHVFNDGREFVVRLKPTPLAQGGEPGLTYQLPTNQHWIPTQSPAIYHFGLRCWMDQLDQYTTIRVFMQYTIQFKGLKL